MAGEGLLSLSGCVGVAQTIIRLFFIIFIFFADLVCAWEEVSPEFSPVAILSRGLLWRLKVQIRRQQVRSGPTQP